MSAANWFEISNEGWRRLNAGRPLGALVREAVQNAFDSGAGVVRVDLDRNYIVIEDDSRRGFDDERLVYTVFYTNKEDSPQERGRKGRGLKELISATRSAVVETVGTTVVFDEGGRRSHPNTRKRGTKLVLQRNNSRKERQEACAFLTLIIPPRGVLFYVNGTQVLRPKPFYSLPPSYLPTVLIKDGIERIVERAARIHLLEKRFPDEQAYIFEMGLPIQPLCLPWHVDIDQRVPLAEGRDHLDDFYRLTVMASIFEALVARRLPQEHLMGDWVMEVLGRCALTQTAITHYVRRTFPKGAVLGSTRRADDRARQAGAFVVASEHLSHGVYQTLARVMLTSEDYANAMLEVQEEIVQPVTPAERHAVALYQYLGQRLLGRSVKVLLMRKPENLAGLIDDATFDGRRFEMKLNVLGSIDLENPLSAPSLSIVLHEFAHARAPEHDQRFILALETLAGQAAVLLMEEGLYIRDKFAPMSV